MDTLGTFLRFDTMDDSTPLPETTEHGQLTVETIDEVAPRLVQFTEDLINRLRTCGFSVKTTTVYLLNSTDHPIEVPCLANGVPIEMNFDATLPVWAPEPRARLWASFNHGRRYFCTERGKKPRSAQFSMSKVFRLFASRITLEEARMRIREEKKQDEATAERAFSALSKKLGIPPDGNTLRKNNLTILCLPDRPSKVTVIMTVPHSQAMEIASKFLQGDS